MAVFQIMLSELPRHGTKTIIHLGLDLTRGKSAGKTDRCNFTCAYHFSLEVLRTGRKSLILAKAKENN